MRAWVNAPRGPAPDDHPRDRRAPVPLGLAFLGYLAAGQPHIECGDSAGTSAFYRVAIPFFAVGALAGAAALAHLSRAGRYLAVPAIAVAIDSLLPGSLHTPATAVVVALGVASLIGAILTIPVSAGLVLAAVTVWVRRRRSPPTRGERRLSTALLAWNLASVLPTTIFLLSLNADPVCFSF